MAETATTRTIPALLGYWSEIDPETPAFIFLGRKEKTVFSRGEIFTKAGKMAAVLKRFCLDKGDIIAVSMYNGQNCPDRLICELGIQLAGCVTVQASPDKRDGQDALDIVRQTNARMAITSDYQFLKEYRMPLSTFVDDFSFTVACPDIPSLKYLICIRNEPEVNLQDVLTSEESTFIEDVSPKDIAQIETTSGTTSYIKCVPFTQEELVEMGNVACMSIGVNSESLFFNDRSMNWQIGYPLYFPISGVTRIMLNHIEQPTLNMFQVLETSAYTLAFLSSEDIHEIYLSKSQCNPQVDKVVMAGQPVKKSSIKEALTFAKSVVNVYGSTEIGFLSYACITENVEFDDYCVGTELPDVQIKIVDDDENPVENGQMGNILVKTPRQASGYLTSDGSVSREGFTEDGWFKIGDLGYRDGEGRLYITGRGRDVILRGDVLIYPHHLEKLFSECPELEDMAVVGVPDPIVHQEICLIVKGDASCKDPTSVAKTYVDTIIDSSDREYSIVPKYFLACESSLRNRNGKLDRKRLIAFAMDKLGISQ